MPGTAPVVKATLDRLPVAPATVPSYNQGELMAMTLTFTDADTKAASTRPAHADISVPDGEGNVGTAAVDFNVNFPEVDNPDKFGITIVDKDGRVWTLKSRAGTQAIYTAVA